jgi:hypothetical protein
MKITPLGLQEQAARGGNYEVEYSHEDLTEAAANTAQTLTVTIAAKMSAQVVEHVIDVPFKDASDAAFNSTTVIVGDGGSTNRLLTSTELNENGTEVLFKKGTGTDYVFTADDTIDITIASMAAKSLSDIDTGRARLLLNIQDRREVPPAS